MDFTEHQTEKDTADEHAYLRRKADMADELAEALREIRDTGTTPTGEDASDMQDVAREALDKYDAMKGEAK